MPTRPPKHKPFRASQPVRRRVAVDTRGGSTARGYDAAWQRLRRAFLAANPLCAMCLVKGVYTTAQDVDHIKPFEDRWDARRLDEGNLQGLCRPCHRRKSETDGTRVGNKQRTQDAPTTTKD